MNRTWSARLSDPWVGRGGGDRARAASPEREVRRRCACDGRLGAGCTACGGRGKKRAQRRAVDREAAAGFDLARLPITAGAAGLDVSQPGDPGERAADAAARAALRDPPAPRSPDADTAPAGAGGTPLPADLRADLEARFDHDFAPVRVHTDAAAHRSAAALDAEAYTVGGDVVFAEGAYAPGSGHGRELIAHELAHVVQETAGAAPGAAVSRRARRDESCAHAAAPRDPCAAIPDADRRRARAMVHGIDELEGMATLLRAPANDASAAERVAMLKAAACTLSPGVAAEVKRTFIDRAHVAGERFGRLATASRCSILDILDARIAAGAALDPTDAALDAAPVAARALRPPADDPSDGGGRDDADAVAAREAREVAQAEHDRELLAKAGRLDAVGFLIPDSLEAYRIPYSEQIRNPLLRFHARINERAAYGIARFGATGIRPLVAEPLAYAAMTAMAFFDCMKSALGRADAQILTRALTADPLGVLDVPSALGRGAVVGIGEDLVDTLTQLRDLLADPAAFARQALELLALAFGPEGEPLGCALGGDIGEQFVETLRAAAPDGLDAVAYQLGRQVGPAIVYTVLAFVAPEISISQFGGRVLSRLFKLLATIADKLPIPKWIRKPAKALAKAAAKIRPHNRRINVGGRLERDAAEFSNLNFPGEKAGAKAIPNHVPGAFKDIGEIFEHGSATEVVSRKLPAATTSGDWPAAARGTYDVLEPGGTFDLDLWGTQADVEEAAAAFRALGWSKIDVSNHGAGAIIRGAK